MTNNLEKKNVDLQTLADSFGTDVSEVKRICEEKLFDIVISVDVLEHIPKQDLGWVVDEIFEYANHVVFVNVACYRALATLSNGDNAHVSIFNPWWWIGFFEAIASKNKVKVFLICTILKKGDRKNPVFITHTINDTIANYK